MDDALFCAPGTVGDRHRLLILIGFTGAGEGLRGGGINRRDRWFGLEDKSDFEAFRSWWHRAGKDEYGGADIGSRDEAQMIFDDWVASGRPKA